MTRAFERKRPYHTSRPYLLDPPDTSSHLNKLFSVNCHPGRTVRLCRVNLLASWGGVDSRDAIWKLGDLNGEFGIGTACATWISGAVAIFVESTQSLIPLSSSRHRHGAVSRMYWIRFVDRINDY